jgi:hypothetical protein
MRIRNECKRSREALLAALDAQLDSNKAHADRRAPDVKKELVSGHSGRITRYTDRVG